MFNADMFGKMLEPMMKPFMEKFEVIAKQVVEAFKELNGRTQRMEPAILEIHNDVVSLHRKLDQLLEAKKDANGTRDRIDTGGDSNGASDSEPRTEGGEPSPGNHH